MSLLTTILILATGLNSRAMKARAVAITLVTAAFSMIGGRLFHVLWERPELLNTPSLIFSRWDGMVFYGAFFAGIFAFALSTKLLFRAERERRRLWDRGAISLALSYGILRVGCFANGCCWGRLTSVPWAVRYHDPHSAMPALGIPVHPVQLYDSFLGLVIAAGLYWLYRQSWHSNPVNARSAVYRGKLMLGFVFLYSISRFFTESFRGDSFRRDTLLFGLSTSQWISVLLLSLAMIAMARERGISKAMLDRFKRRRPIALAIIAGFSLSGCLLPQPPQESWFSSHETVRPGFEIFISKQNVFSLGIKTRARGNAVFLTADTYIFKSLSEKLSASLHENSLLSLDELTWREEAPYLAAMYKKIVVIGVKEAKKQTMLQALAMMEKSGQPYDIYLLTHGIPNHLSSGEGYFFSFNEIGALKKQLKNLRLVFMQSCFGSTLAPDWIAAGAKEVISFDGFNRNFFFITFFLRWYRYFDVREAFQKTISNMPDSLERHLLYSELLRALGFSIDDYLRSAPNPELHSAPL
jgi:phosphatidylglycerol:prolipoprotein diacylglycerol transferase